MSPVCPRHGGECDPGQAQDERQSPDRTLQLLLQSLRDLSSWKSGHEWHVCSVRSGKCHAHGCAELGYVRFPADKTKSESVLDNAMALCAWHSVCCTPVVRRAGHPPLTRRAATAATAPPRPSTDMHVSSASWERGRCSSGSSVRIVMATGNTVSPSRAAQR